MSHTLLSCLSPTYTFNKPTSEAGLLNQSSRLAPALGVTKCHNCHIYDFGHSVVLLKSHLDVQQTHLWSCLKLQLSASFFVQQTYLMLKWNWERHAWLNQLISLWMTGTGFSSSLPVDRNVEVVDFWPPTGAHSGKGCHHPGPILQLMEYSCQGNFILSGTCTIKPFTAVNHGFSL